MTSVLALGMSMLNACNPTDWHSGTSPHHPLTSPHHPLSDKNSTFLGRMLRPSRGGGVGGSSSDGSSGNGDNSGTTHYDSLSSMLDQGDVVWPCAHAAAQTQDKLDADVSWWRPAAHSRYVSRRARSACRPGAACDSGAGAMDRYRPHRLSIGVARPPLSVCGHHAVRRAQVVGAHRLATHCACAARAEPSRPPPTHCYPIAPTRGHCSCVSDATRLRSCGRPSRAVSRSYSESHVYRVSLGQRARSVACTNRIVGWHWQTDRSATRRALATRTLTLILRSGARRSPL
jgi:hypothetical protein